MTTKKKVLLTLILICCTSLSILLGFTVAKYVFESDSTGGNMNIVIDFPNTGENGFTLITGPNFNKVLKGNNKEGKLLDGYNYVFGHYADHEDAVKNIGEDKYTNVALSTDGAVTDDIRFYVDTAKRVAYILSMEKQGDNGELISQPILANTNCSQMFMDISFGTIDFSNFDTHFVANMSRMFMNTKMGYSYNSDGNEMDLSLMVQIFEKKNLTNVTNMSYMFAKTEISAERSSANIAMKLGLAENCNMSYMFFNIGSLTAITLSMVNPGDVSYMFSDCTHLTSVTLEMYGGQGLESMFENNSELERVDVTLVGVNDASRMFHDRDKIQDVTITLNSVSKFDYMFDGCKNISTVKGKFNTVDDLSNLFAYNGTITSADITLINVKTAENMFTWCTGIRSLGLYVEKTQNIDGMFNGCMQLNDVHGTNGQSNVFVQVNSAVSLFESCSQLTSFNGAIISDGDASKMFRGCTRLSTVTIGSGSTAIGQYAFQNCNALSSVTFESPTGWQVSTSVGGTGTEIGGLDNPTTAALYLKNTYCAYYWKRSA